MTLEQILHQIRLLEIDPSVVPAVVPDVGLLCELIACLRPDKSDDIGQATQRIAAASAVLRSDPVLAQALCRYLTQVVVSRKLLHLLTDTGITKGKGFWGVFMQQLAEKMLPPLHNDEYVKDVFGLLFHEPRDYVWVSGVDDAVWTELILSLGFHIRAARAAYQTVTQEILNAIQVLSYRIATVGLEAELVRNYPAIERFESPFLRQNDAINQYVECYTAWLAERRLPREDSLHIEVLMAQCEEIALKIRRTASHQGVSIDLTRLLLQLTQSIQRLRTLLRLLDTRDVAAAVQVNVRLLKDLVWAHNQHRNLSELVKTNTELLSLQVTEHAGRSGEHYVTNSRTEWMAMMRSAMGAGVIVGFMAMIKLLLSTLLVAPFAFAMLFSLNYSFGFMLVHILHFTIATKQPAMTAAMLANSLDLGKQQVDKLVELIVRVVRSQFIAILGNIALAMPVSYAIAWAWFGITGSHLVTPEKAQHLLHDLDPIHSLALPHAAIAGVCLFLSGLISGYYDNKARYASIPARLRQLLWLRNLLGAPRLERVSHYLGENLGALMGNMFFGIMLGSIGQIGLFLGLPIDIRHITFSSAYFAFALAGLDNVMRWQVLATSLSGIFLIGIINLGVSFSLALAVAMRSRRVNFGRRSLLIKGLWQRSCSRSRDFFWPDPDEVLTDTADEHHIEPK